MFGSFENLPTYSIALASMVEKLTEGTCGIPPAVAFSWKLLAPPTLPLILTLDLDLLLPPLLLRLEYLTIL